MGNKNQISCRLFTCVGSDRRALIFSQRDDYDEDRLPQPPADGQLLILSMYNTRICFASQPSIPSGLWQFHHHQQQHLLVQ